MAPRTLVDALLDRTVLAGYTSLGYRLRRACWPKRSVADDALRGRTAAITGAASGVGLAVTTGLAARGATVFLLVRDEDNGTRAREHIRARHPRATVEIVRCDVSDLTDVRRCARELGSTVRQLDVLVHNAGVLPETRTETSEGNELTLATHVLGPHLLTDQLRPKLDAAPRARVVFVSSGGMYTQRLRVDDPHYLRGQYRGATAYARTKRMQVVLAALWAKQLRDTDIAVNATHPGWVDTPGLAESLPGFHRLARTLLRSPEQGADTVVWLAENETVGRTGGFWHDRLRRPEHRSARTRESAEDRHRLWRLCAELTEAPHEGRTS